MQEILYNSIMEWVLRKIPSNVEQALMIDDTDKISSTVAVTVLMDFYHTCDDIIKQKILHDLFLLQSNITNTRCIIDTENFLTFILDLLFGFQEKMASSADLQPSETALRDLCLKIYSHLMKFVITSEKNGVTYIERVFHWYVRRKTGILESESGDSKGKAQQRDLRTLELFVRYVWCVTIRNIKNYADSNKLRYQSIFLENFSSIVYLTYELAMQMVTGGP